ncbi:HYC_CC_PP family protein [Parasediminibacterium sp. JCM 36343]|uniref:HYC_CC_PP family protein n=1 Tax=Parasediminibacterium sp. JCM 36343 TaxID=3374279 RepID=UPI00397B598B
MKKLVAIFFLVIYSLTTVGANLQSHYCMGEYIGASLYHTAKEKCGRCGMTKAKSEGCCKDEHIYVKLKREHQTQHTINFSFFSIPIILPSFFIHNQIGTTSIAKTCTPIHAPPNLLGQKIYILNCVYLI